jgi:hypothetical protein
LREPSAADVLTGNHDHEVPDEVRDLDHDRERLVIGGEDWWLSAKATITLRLWKDKIADLRGSTKTRIMSDSKDMVGV